MNNYFTGRKIVIATMHGKEKAIAPLLKNHFGADLFVPSNFDTDKYGTFTREIKRHGDQKEVARKKALAAIKHSNVDIAIASEGSFYPHPGLPFISTNAELVLLVDLKNGIEVEGYAQSSATNHLHAQVSSLSEVILFAKKIGFPEHGIILRRSRDGRKMEKEIKTWEELENKATRMFSSFFAGFFVKTLYLETDMRAHRNPTRMKVIESAALDLIKNIESLCPSCGAIGFCKEGVAENLTCARCILTTNIPGSFLYTCQKCEYKEKRSERDFASPEECSYCNP